MSGRLCVHGICYVQVLSGPLTLANLGGAPSLGERKLVVAQNEHHTFLIHYRVLQAHPSSRRVVGQGQLCGHHHLAGLPAVGFANQATPLPAQGHRG